MILHDDPLCTLYLGDCVEVMRELPAESVDAVVTDPPYGLGFMGKAWDSQAALASRPPSAEVAAANGNDPYPRTGKGPKAVAFEAHGYQDWCEDWGREAFRVAKPGAHLLAFGGTRTYHRLASAIEDAGWEIRDCLVWAYASGFPKSLDVSKAIDKAAGAEREVVGQRANLNRTSDRSQAAAFNSARGGMMREDRDTFDDTPIPATPDAAKWNGWGTALKPAWEPIVMARKPLGGTVAANVLAHGTGALNIDATRIGYAGPADRDEVDGKQSVNPTGNTGLYGVPGIATFNPAGRWPANLMLTDPIFDGDTPGVVGGGSSDSAQPYERSVPGRSSFLPRPMGPDAVNGYGDSGSYSRFFELPHGRRGILSVCPICGASDAGSSSTARTPEADTAPPSAAISLPEPSAQPASSAGSQSGLWSTDSAPSPAPTEESSDSATRTDSPTTSATEKPSSPAPSVPTSRTRPSRGSRRGKPSPKSDPASPAAQSETSSDTMTITPSQQWCDSCVADAMRSSMAGQESAERNYPWAFLIPKSSRSDREPRGTTASIPGPTAPRSASAHWIPAEPSSSLRSCSAICTSGSDPTARRAESSTSSLPRLRRLDWMRG